MGRRVLGSRPDMRELTDRALDAASGLGAAYADVRVVRRREESIAIKSGRLEGVAAGETEERVQLDGQEMAVPGEGQDLWRFLSDVPVGDVQHGQDASGVWWSARHEGYRVQGIPVTVSRRGSVHALAPIATTGDATTACASAFQRARRAHRLSVTTPTGW